MKFKPINALEFPRIKTTLRRTVLDSEVLWEYDCGRCDILFYPEFVAFFKKTQTLYEGDLERINENLSAPSGV